MSAALPVDDERPVGPRSSKGTRTRARLMQGAKEVFEENGFADARISDIAERAGVSYGSFYHYFVSKEEVFREVASKGEPDLEPGDLASKNAATAEVDTIEQLETAISRYLVDYRREARIMRVIEQVSRHDDVLSASRLDRHLRCAEQVAACIRRCQRLGLADPAIEPTTGSILLLSMVLSFAEAWLVRGDLRCSFDEGVAQLNRLCMGAIGITDRSQPGTGRGGAQAQ